MAIGLIGRKCGMTRVFTEAGESIPVSVILVEPNRITQIKTVSVDGYAALQVATGTKKAHRVTKAIAGHHAKAKVVPGRLLKEFRVDGDIDQYTIGDELTVALFKESQVVDVQGVTKGKGFAGVVKRHNFATQDMTHGNSLSHRAPGSIGQNQTPGRVFKGKKMAGQMGNCRRTAECLKIVSIDADRNLILVKGAIPGAPGGNVIVLPAVKAGEKNEA
jgi:large subunit ribosomal protein L3